MPISLRTATAAAAGGWTLGETRAIASAEPTLDLGAGQQALCRNTAVTLLASAYPDFYNQAVSAAVSKMFATRTATGVSTVTALEDNGAATFIATGPNGGISRSTNGGATFASVSSGSNANLGTIAHGNGVWIIATSQGGLLRSTNDGQSWSAVPGTGVFNPSGVCRYLNGAFIYAQGFGTHDSPQIWRSQDAGLTWTDITGSALGGTSGKLLSLTTGQGLHVLLRGNTPRFSGDGGLTWQTGTNRALTNPATGLYYVGGLWVSGSHLPDSTSPISSGVPPAPVVGNVWSASENLQGDIDIKKINNQWNGLDTLGDRYHISGIDNLILGADEGGLILGSASKSYVPASDVPKILSGTGYDKYSLTGANSSHPFSHTSSGTIYKTNPDNNQVAVKANAAVLEIELPAYTANTKPGVSSWYTRVL